MKRDITFINKAPARTDKADLCSFERTLGNRRVLHEAKKNADKNLILVLLRGFPWLKNKKTYCWIPMST